MKTKYSGCTILFLATIGHSNSAELFGQLGLNLGLNLNLPIIGRPGSTPTPKPASQSQSQSGLVGKNGLPLPLVSPLLSNLPNTIGVQLPLVSSLPSTVTKLIGCAATNPADLSKLNLSISPLGLGQSHQFTCPSCLGIFPDPDDCTSLYVCVLSVVELKLTCKPGYHYEPNSLPLICKPNETGTLPESCNRCATYKTPQQCSSSPYGCSFCLQNDNFTGKSRCDSYANLIKAGCKQSEIFDNNMSTSTTPSGPIVFSVPTAAS